MPKLTNHRREKFCRLYVGQSAFNASHAARSAGYSLLSCAGQGSDLLQNPIVQARVAELMAAEAELLEMSAEEARVETGLLAAFNMADLYSEDGELIPIHELPREVAACINEVEYHELHRVLPKKIKAGKDKLAALDKIHRIHGSYEADNKGTGEIHIHLDAKDMKA